MPGIVKPIEEQDHLGTMQAMAEYLKNNLLGERGALPRSESGKYTYDLNPVEVFDKKKNSGGAIYAEPSTTMDAQAIDPMGLAKVGGGVKNVLGKIAAGPWRSRTLEAIEKNPKMPSSANPQTWLSKLRGAGLPKDEVAVAENFLSTADPKSKLSREQLHTSLNQGGAKETYEKAFEEWQGIKDFRAPGELAKAHKLEETMERSLNASNLPTLGVTKTTLGGAEWEAGQKRMNELRHDIEMNLRKLEHHERHSLGSPGRENILGQREQLIKEQMQLANDAVGKRPKWPEYNIEGLKDYKEEYLHAPLKEGGTYRNSDMEMHFPDKPDNLLYIKHSGTLELPDGKKSTHLSTLQNDHAAEFDAMKGKVGNKVYLMEGLDGPYPAAPLEDVAIQHDPNSLPFTYNRRTGEHLEEFDSLQEAQEKLQQYGEYPKIPEPIMLNTWWKHGLKGSIKDAVKAGHDYFTWDPAETQMKRFAGAGEDVAQYMKNHYDNNIPGFLKKEYGVEAKKVSLGTENVRVKGIDQYGREILVPRNEVITTPNELGGYDIVHRDHGIIAGPFVSRQSAEGGIVDMTIGNKEQKQVWQIPITEEIKKKVQEGQFWSKAAKPGGNHAEGVA